MAKVRVPPFDKCYLLAGTHNLYVIVSIQVQHLFDSLPYWHYKWGRHDIFSSALHQGTKTHPFGLYLCAICISSFFSAGNSFELWFMGWQASDKYCIRMPNKWNFSFDYFYAAILALGIYVPGTYQFFSHRTLGYCKTRIGTILSLGTSDGFFVLSLARILSQVAHTCILTC